MVGDMWRMLSVAEAFGVGSNRPLGLGAVRVTPLQWGGIVQSKDI
jgi:CRISPR/Cas system endoribonuclease Cas6 (RAMP superfamily)